MLRLSSGLRVRVLESGNAQGEPLVLIHGWGASVYTFRYVLDGLGETGRRVIAFDQRGHGLSDKPAARGDYSTDHLVRDVNDLLGALEIPRVDILGHSLGGGVALRFALAHGARVRQLVLAAPVHLTTLHLPTIGQLLAPRFTNLFSRFLTPRWLTNILLRWTYGDPHRVTDRDVDEYWAPSQFPAYYCAARSLLEEFDWSPLSGQQLATIGCPTLVILSTADRLIRGAEAPAAFIPQARVRTLVGAGHLGIEECAREFNRELVNFLGAA
jgi:pimeloyl-ACP methyl ester carboxylesterase